MKGFTKRWAKRQLWAWILGVAGVLALGMAFYGRGWSWGEEGSTRSMTALVRDEDIRAATAGFRPLGPKGVRFLARKLRNVGRTNSWKRLMGALPPRVAERVGRWLGDESHKEEEEWHAVEILQNLGEAAAPAVPDLEQLLADPELDPGYKLQWARTLGMIGPKASSAIPLLKALTTNDDAIAAAAARALWQIDGETNLALDVFSNCLRGPRIGRMEVFPLLEEGGEDAERRGLPMAERALTNRDLMVRRQAEMLLWKMDPERLARVNERINREANEALERHIEALTNVDYGKRMAAMEALRVFGPAAAAAGPQLATNLEKAQRMIEKSGGVGIGVAVSERNECIDTLIEIGAAESNAVGTLARELEPEGRPALERRYAEPTKVCRALGAIGPAAKEAAPRLEQLVTNNMVWGHWGGWGFNDRRGNFRYPEATVEAAAALSRIDPENEIARRALRAFATNAVAQLRDIAAVALWRLGVETNLPVREIVAGARNHSSSVGMRRRGQVEDAEGGGAIYSEWSQPERAIELLGEIGPAAKEALPVLKTYIAPDSNYRVEAAIAIRKIDPAKAEEWGLPGLLIAVEGD